MTDHSLPEVVCAGLFPGFRQEVRGVAVSGQEIHQWRINSAGASIKNELITADMECAYQSLIDQQTEGLIDLGSNFHPCVLQLGDV